MVIHMTDRRRRATVERRSHTVYVDESLWQQVDKLVYDGTFPSASAAIEAGMRLVVNLQAATENDEPQP